MVMYYLFNIELVFLFVEYIIRDVYNGYILRYLYVNGVLFFFMVMFMYMVKGLYYGLYRLLRVLLWNVGVIIFILIIVIVFNLKKFEKKEKKVDVKKEVVVDIEEY